jgi:hypothetical protein
MTTTFLKLNEGWNADPNAPCPEVHVEGDVVFLRFFVNYFTYPAFSKDDVGVLRFDDCWRYRMGSVNDEGWYRGQCRFSRLAPDWGEFYQVQGDLLLDRVPKDWTVLSTPESSSKHFLFYLRDETFECDASDWSFSLACGHSA